MPLEREIEVRGSLSIGECAITFLYYDRTDLTAMFKIFNREAKSRRDREPLPFYLAVGQSFTLPNGVTVRLKPYPTQKRIQIDINNPAGLHIDKGKLWERGLRLVAG